MLSRLSIELDRKAPVASHAPIILIYMTNNDNLSLSKFIVIGTHILDKLAKKIFPRLSIPNRKT